LLRIAGNGRSVAGPEPRAYAKNAGSNRTPAYIEGHQTMAHVPQGHGSLATVVQTPEGVAA